MEGMNVFDLDHFPFSFLCPEAPYSTPYATPYTTPYETPYATPYATPYSTPYETPYTTPYETPYGTPYATPYETPYATPYATPYPTPYPTPAGIDHVLISEVHYDLDGAHGSEPGNEWIELHNGTGVPVDVGGWKIGDSASSSADAIPDGTVIPDGGFLFLTASSTTASFWSIPGSAVIAILPSASIGGNGLGNAGDSVYLWNGAILVDTMSYGSTTDPVFDPTAPTVSPGHSLARTSTTTDTDTASDWADLEVPTPGSF
jgi:hypothetical protein